MKHLHYLSWAQSNDSFNVNLQSQANAESPYFSLVFKTLSKINEMQKKIPSRRNYRTIFAFFKSSNCYALSELCFKLRIFEHVTLSHNLG